MAFFRVRAVEVRGARYLQPGEIVSRLQVDTLASLWDDLEPFRRRVRRIRRWRTSRIERKLPGTLVVIVAGESPGRARSDSRTGLLPFDSRGRSCRSIRRGETLDLPIVASADPVLLKLVGAIRAAQPRVFARIEEARRRGGTKSCSRSLPSRRCGARGR